MDDEPWQPATIDAGEDAEFAWKVWSLASGQPGCRRARDHLARHRLQGHVQPVQDDAWIAGKHAYGAGPADVPGAVQGLSAGVVRGRANQKDDSNAHYPLSRTSRPGAVRPADSSWLQTSTDELPR
jgi:hypothetical protein